MKKIMAVVLIAVTLCSMVIVPSDAKNYNVPQQSITDLSENMLPNDMFNQGKNSLGEMFMWLPVNYNEGLNTNIAETLHEMFIAFETGRIEGEERERIIKKYGFETFYHGNFYYLNEIEQTFNATFNTNVDIKALNGLKFNNIDEPFIKIVDNYFCVNMFPHGTNILTSPKCGYKLNEVSEYWIWYYKEPVWNVENDYQDWWQSEPYYTIVTNKNIMGYNIKAIDYMSTIPPTDEQLARYKQPKITVTLNGKEIQFDQPPILVNDRTLVPMRAIFESMGCEVYWNEENQAVDVWRGDYNVMTLWIGDNEMWTQNGFVELDVPPQVVNDRTLVPVRAISETLNCNVEWDDDTQTVIISSDLSESNGVCDASLQYNNLEYFLKNEFENTELTAQGEPYNDIDTDTNYVTAYHEIKDYAYIDIDKDGCDELIVSSEARRESYPKQSFSIWDCDESGNVFCVLNKFGQTSRSAYRYFISEYDGDIYILESTGEGNSAGHTSYRNLYTYDGKSLYPEIKLFAHVSFDLNFDDWESFTIDGIESDRDYVCSYIDDLDTDSIFLYEQFGYMQ